MAELPLEIFNKGVDELTDAIEEITEDDNGVDIQAKVCFGSACTHIFTYIKIAQKVLEENQHAHEVPE